jgi:hypothetical protein
MKTLTEKETSAFHAQFCPFAERIYRSALIVTGSPRSAEQLQVDIYLKAFVEYLLARDVANFKSWLTKIVSECFADYELYSGEIDTAMKAVYQTYHVTLKNLIDCKKTKMRHETLFTA